MQLSYFHVAADVPDCGPSVEASSKADAAVVIDVLRATTTIAWALQNGAEAVQTFSDLDELRSSAEQWPADLRLLVGERGGKTLDGFDLGKINGIVLFNDWMLKVLRMIGCFSHFTSALL